MSEQAKVVNVREIRLVAERLAQAYPYIRGKKQAEGVLTDAPLDSLLRAILSQNTTDRNRDRAFAALQERFAGWDTVEAASVEEVADAIRETNYAYTKAGRIQHILRLLRQEHGVLSLDFLTDWPTDRILDYLTGFPGVGPKSAAIVALFALKRPVMPVDTHVYRVTQRLGWISEHTTPERAHRVLRELVPPELVFPLHVGLWEHGRITCRPVPKCGQCAIYACCMYPAKTAPEPSVSAAIALTAGKTDIAA